jgi:antitoxin YefM
MLSKDEYDNIIENIHVLGNKVNREWLLLGKKQAEVGNLREVEIE